MTTEEQCIFWSLVIGALATVAFGVHGLMPEIFSLEVY